MKSFPSSFEQLISPKAPSFFCLGFRIKIECDCEEICVYTIQQPVFVFNSLKLVKDYIFLIKNNLTMIKKNEKAEELMNAKYHSISIFIFLTCVGIIITT